MSVTFTIPGTPPTAVVLDPVPGTLKTGGGHKDAGGDNIPQARLGLAANGSLQVVVQASGDASEATLFSLRSPPGAGNRTVASDNQTAYAALVDVSIEGDAVQLATITWKGRPTE